MDNFNEIKEKVKKILENSNSSHDWEHTERVYNLCLKLADKDTDMEILKLAAVLHDIARPLQDESKGKICHAEEGSKIAKKTLMKYGYSEDVINNVAHCIETHRFRNNKIPESNEAKILFDADKLDSIGAVGIGRAFSFASIQGARLHNNDINIEKTEEYTKEDTAYREFMVKLRHVKDRMLTKKGRKMAEDRHKFMINFFDRLDKEFDGDL